MSTPKRATRRAAFTRAARKAALLFATSYRQERAEAVEPPRFLRDKEKIEFIQGWTGSQELEGLYLLASLVPPTECIVEIGSFFGRSTAALALGTGSRERAVVSVDPHDGGDGPGVSWQSRTPVTSEQALRFNLAVAGITEAVEIHVQTSKQAAREFTDERPVGLLFVDGLHTEEAVVTDVSVWARLVSQDVIVVFDDWMFPDVMEGIKKLERDAMLPPRLGSLGRHLVFSSPDRVTPVLPRLKTLAEIAAGNRWFLRDRASRYFSTLAVSTGDPAPIGSGVTPDPKDV
jgi:predicted O-methyltransferase YrrM